MIIDIDSHFHEPVDWLTVVEPELAAELPPGERFADQVRKIMLLRLPPTLPESERPEDGFELMSANSQAHIMKADSRHPDHYDPDSGDPMYTAEGRLKVMDASGVDVAFLNPTFTSGHTFTALLSGNFEVIPTLSKAANTFRAMLVEGHTDRLIPVTAVNMEDLDWTIAEMTRMRELGSRAVHLSQPSSKSITHPDYDRFWSACEDLGMLAFVHVFFGEGVPHPSWANNGRGMAAYREAVVPSDYRIEVRNLLNAMVFDEVFERHPKVQVVISEAGMAWLPILLHELDYKAEAKLGMDGLPHESERSYDLPLLPSEYIARQVKVSPLIGFVETNYEHLSVREVMEQLPDDMVVFSSDFPHVEGRSDAVARYEAHLPDDPRIRARFYGDTMAEVLDLDPADYATTPLQPA